MKNKITSYLIALILMSPIVAYADCLDNFCLPGRNGQNLCRTDIKGKVILYDFWTSWCPNCRASLELLSSFKEKFSPDDLTIVAVNLDENKSDADEIIKTIPSSIQVLVDTKGSLAEQCNLPSIPYTILTTGDGSTFKRWNGFSDKTHKEITGQVEELLQKGH